MAEADDFLKTWVHQLTAMQSCMKQINTDTDLDLAKFYARKLGDLPLTPHQKEQFRSCFFEKTNLTIADDDFGNCKTFHELLDACYRPLLDSVAGVMRAEATDDGGPYGGMPLDQFGAVKTAAAFPAASIDGLCTRLAAAMDPLFQANNQAFRAILGKPDTTVVSAAQSIV